MEFSTEFTSSNPARVLLVDDHPIVREGLTCLINAAGDLVVCGQAAGGDEALRMLSDCDPHIAVVDISLADRNGVAVIRELLAVRPKLPCLALSMYDESMYAMRVLRAGGRGYVMKQEVPKKIVVAIRKVLTGQVYLSDAMATRLVDHVVTLAPTNSHPTSELSDRELEILTLLGQTLSTRQIGERLYISHKTVEAHRERIKEKLHLNNGAELLRYAVQYTLDRARSPALAANG
jgi:DNA-binding NarL/FixJ family response regulator